MADYGEEGCNYRVTVEDVGLPLPTIFIAYPNTPIRAQLSFDPDIVNGVDVERFIDETLRGHIGYQLHLSNYVIATVDGRGTFSLLERHGTTFIPHWRHIHLCPSLIQALHALSNELMEHF